jgi:hypothetical protein
VLLLRHPAQERCQEHPRARHRCRRALYCPVLDRRPSQLHGGRPLSTEAAAAGCRSWLCLALWESALRLHRCLIRYLQAQSPALVLRSVCRCGIAVVFARAACAVFDRVEPKGEPARCGRRRRRAPALHPSVVPVVVSRRANVRVSLSARSGSDPLSGTLKICIVSRKPHPASDVTTNTEGTPRLVPWCKFATGLAV